MLPAFKRDQTQPQLKGLGKFDFLCGSTKIKYKGSNLTLHEQNREIKQYKAGHNVTPLISSVNQSLIF